MLYSSRFAFILGLSYFNLFCVQTTIRAWGNDFSRDWIPGNGGVLCSVNTNISHLLSTKFCPFVFGYVSSLACYGKFYKEKQNAVLALSFFSQIILVCVAFDS